MHNQPKIIHATVINGNDSHSHKNSLQLKLMSNGWSNCSYGMFIGFMSWIVLSIFSLFMLFIIDSVSNTVINWFASIGLTNSLWLLGMTELFSLLIILMISGIVGLCSPLFITMPKQNKK